MIEKLAKDILQYRKVLIAGHINPDPDAVCSATALAAALSEKGVSTKVYFAHKPSESILKVACKVNLIHDLPSEPFDCLIAVDSASENRLGDLHEELRAKAGLCINIDHHISNTKWGDINFVDAEAASTASIIFDLICKIDHKLLSKSVAHSLYAGLLDDTGCFCYSNTDAEALSVAAALVAAGAEPHLVNQALYESMSVNSLRLTALSLGTLSYICSKKIAVMHCDFTMLKEADASGIDAEGLSSFSKKVGGVLGSVFLRETAKGWKVSLRSKTSDLDVNQVASAFGGGGHKAAAGCTLVGELSEVLKNIESEINDKL